MYWKTERNILYQYHNIKAHIIEVCIEALFKVTSLYYRISHIKQGQNANNFYLD